MKVGASRSQIDDAHKTLRAKWQATAEVWDDGVKVEFEERIGEPLDRATTELLRAIDHVAVTFGQIRAECEFG
jgi:hypothetical protein